MKSGAFVVTFCPMMMVMSLNWHEVGAAVVAKCQCSLFLIIIFVCIKIPHRINNQDNNYCLKSKLWSVSIIVYLCELIKDSEYEQSVSIRQDSKVV